LYADLRDAKGMLSEERTITFGAYRKTAKGSPTRNAPRASSLPYMSERAEACRRKASECELAARLASDPEMRTMYRALAHEWWEIAKEIEQIDQLSRQRP